MTGADGIYIEPRVYQNYYKNMLKSSKVKEYNFHVLRHTFATNCIEVGMDIKSLSEILGHATVDILSHINPNIVIHRVSGDAPKDLLVAPDWNSHKKWIMNGLDKYLCENDLWQGKYYNN